MPDTCCQNLGSLWEMPGKNTETGFWRKEERVALFLCQAKWEHTFLLLLYYKNYVLAGGASEEFYNYYNGAHGLGKVIRIKVRKVLYSSSFWIISKTVID